MPLAKATDLDRWAADISAPGELPRLVRRLILATAKPSEISFGADKAIHFGGWDGRIRAKHETPFVPAGASFWELGTNAEAGDKAQSDYRKRTKKTPADARAKSTFVFVSPRRWPGKEAWLKKRRSEGAWLDIRAYNADDLEIWLEMARAVHIWFSRFVGLRTAGEMDFETYWLAYSEAVKPSFPSPVILEGRKNASQRIRDWARQDARKPTLTLRAESREEAIAVAIASLLLEEDGAEVSRGLVVSSRDAWDQLALPGSPLLLVPDYPIGNEFATATRNGHRVIVPLGYSDGPSSTSTVELPRLPVREVARWLEDSGYPATVAWEYAQTARRSLTSFRRLLAVSTGSRSPAWASASEGPALTAFLLAGSWEDSSLADRELLAELSGKSYETLEKLTLRHCNSTDALLRRLDSAWMLVSKEDAWRLLGRFVSASEFERFEKIATTTLHPNDPSPHRPIEVALAAVGEQQSPSLRLVQSLAENLALLGSNPAVLCESGPRARGLVGRIVGKVFDRVDCELRFWQFLSSRGLLTDLALADPDAFLNALEGTQAAALVSLFESDNDSDFLTSSSFHTDLLFALAALAWAPDHLGRVVPLLSRLATLDPGGDIGPRPSDVLHAIFNLCQPATAADWTTRREILEHFVATAPAIALPLLRGLIEARSWTVPSPPRWRDWAPNGSQMLSEDAIWEQGKQVVEWLLAQSQENPDGLPELVHSIAFGALVPEEADDLLVGLLESLDSDSLSAGTRRDIAKELRLWRTALREDGRISRLSQHLEGLLARLEPENPVLRHCWLFDWNPPMPEYRQGDLDRYDEVVRTRRLEALREVVGRCGFEGVLCLSEQARNPDSVGTTLAELGDAGPPEGEPLELLNSAKPTVLQMIHGWCRQSIELRGTSWAERTAARLAKSGAVPAACFLQAAPRGTETWDFVGTLGPEVKSEYWRRLMLFAARSPDEAARALRELLEVGRPDQALQLTQTALPHLPYELALEVLEAAIRDGRGKSNHPQNLKELLQFLQPVESIESSRLIPIEWHLLPLCELHYPNPLRPVRSLEEFARRPAFFAQVVCWLYRAEGEHDDREETNHELREVRAKGTYLLLPLVKSLPGIATDGFVDSGKLSNWLGEVERLLTERGRGHVAQRVLGKIVGQVAPLDSDGAWPHRAIRDLLEQGAQPAFDRGFCDGAQSRFGLGAGRVTVQIEESRKLAAQFQNWAQANSSRSPKTSALLRSIATYFNAVGDLNEQMETEFDEAGW